MPLSYSSSRLNPPEDFERLVTDLKVELKPDGRQEEETVLAIARNDWLKHRLMRAERMAFRKNPVVAELEKGRRQKLGRCRKFCSADRNGRL